MLKKVFICENCTAGECEETINQAIQDNPNYVVNYEMLVENSIRYGNVAKTYYTLLINIGSEDDE